MRESHFTGGKRDRRIQRKRKKKASLFGGGGGRSFFTEWVGGIEKKKSEKRGRTLHAGAEASS